MTAASAGTWRWTAPPPRPGSRPRPVRTYSSGNEDYLRRLRRIEGHVRALQKVIEANTCYPDVVPRGGLCHSDAAGGGRRGAQRPHQPLRDGRRRSTPHDGDTGLNEVAATIGQVVGL